MIKLENCEVVGWEHAIRGMRNPKNSWEKSDSDYGPIICSKCDDCESYKFEDWDACDDCEVEKIINNAPPGFMIGPNDHELMMKLANAGPVHGKFRRMITVYVDITAPLYWWKEFDTYKVGTVANSCSTMHKIHAKEFTVEDFSCEHLMSFDEVYDTDDEIPYCEDCGSSDSPVGVLDYTIQVLNKYRIKFLETKDKKYWWQMIQLLPSSYNQKRTVELNYEVLANIYQYRKNHKLDEWREFCKWIEQLPYSEIITGERDGE